jgi:ribosomal protein S18 acetylase RimI-like enzyme
MSLIFTPAVPGQLSEVEELMRLAFTPYMRALGREIPPDHYDWFVDAVKAGGIFVALDGAEIVGAIATKPGDREGEMVLALIAVSPTRQKSGIASYMIGEIERIARARSLRALSLVTAEMMEDRVRLYSRHGFRILRRGPQAQGRDPHVRVYMTKTLAAG